MAKAQKLDLARQHKSEYAAPKTPALVEEGPAKYLTITGAGEPGTEAFQAKVAAAEGLAFHGHHHEIYLSDPRRVAPERPRTILRHPVRPGK